MRKRLIVFFSLVILSFPVPVLASADDAIHLNVDGIAASVTIKSDAIDAGRVLVPLRTVGETLGAIVQWNDATRTVTMQKGNRIVQLPVDDYFVTINGQEMMIDTPARIRDGLMFVPIRLASEALDVRVQWNDATRTVDVFTQEAPAADRALKPAVFDAESLTWLARIIYSEANGEPYEGQIAVGSVIMNRVRSGEFPGTVKGVIFQKDGNYYQFAPVRTGKIYHVQPDETAWKAAKVALSGVDLTNGALYFYNPAISTSSGWFANKTTTVVIGHHAFVK